MGECVDKINDAPIVDWRDVPPETVRGLLLAERCRALEERHWDLAHLFRTVEQARHRGDLPGLILRSSSGTAVGWVFFVLSNRLLQIGGLHAETAGGVRRLLTAVMHSPEAALAQGVSCFLHARSPSLASALTRLGFDLQRYEYLEAMLTPSWPVTAPEVPSQAMTHADAPHLVRLLARGYDGQAVSRAFAPNARLDEWATYVRQLLSGPSAGAWRPDLSLVLTAPDGRLAGAIVVTEVASGVAHVAQLVVDPDHRRRGVARALLSAAGAAAAAQGVTRVTLMVSDANDRALALYRSLGFSPRSVFLQGRRGPVSRTLNGVTIRGRLGRVA
jgi:ribosomal protein S18 acetylase RimI-like enzyme